MATFKALVQYKKADGTYNVKIRVTHGQRVHYIATGLFVTDSDLTKSKKIKNVRILEECERLVSAMRSRCNARAAVLQQLTLEEVVAIATDDSEGWRLDFPAFCLELVEEMKADGRTGTAACYVTAVNKLKKYLGRDTLDINELTAERLAGFYNYVREKTPTSAVNYIKLLGHCFREAKLRYNDDDAGIVRIPRSPFDRVKAGRPPVPEKRALPAETIRALMDYTGKYRLYVDFFLLSFYLCGMNIADLEEAREAVGGYITYRRKKTRRLRSDSAEIRLKVPPEASEIIARHKGTGGRLVSLGHTLSTFCTLMSRAFKIMHNREGFPRFSYYSARHSWATIAVNDCRIDKYVVHEALIHSVSAVAITDVYIKKDFTAIDEANRRVIDFVKSTKPNI